MTEEKKYSITLRFSERQAKEFVSEVSLKIMGGGGTGMVDAMARWVAKELNDLMKKGRTS